MDLLSLAQIPHTCRPFRENERVQCFSAGLAEGHRTIPAGIPITSAEQLGRVYAIREKSKFAACNSTTFDGF